MKLHAIAIAIAFTVATVAPTARADLPREDGATYLEGMLPEPVRVTLAKRAPIFSTLAGSLSLGALEPGQKVDVVAVSDRAVRVRGHVQGRGVSGWVGRAFVEEPRANFFDDVEKAGARAEAVARLIESCTPAIGMTGDEVVAALGTPDAHTTSVDADGHSVETLSFITIRRVPQHVLRRDVYGNLYRTVVYTEIETGRTTVLLRGGAVIRVDAAARHGFAAQRTPTVPPPVAL